MMIPLVAFYSEPILFGFNSQRAGYGYFLPCDSPQFTQEVCQGVRFNWYLAKVKLQGCGCLGSITVISGAD
jgi:hypothetical protein